MLRSRSQWAQADAVGCLGWLVGNISATALREIIPLTTQLMVKHTMTGDEVFIQQEREREEQATRGRNRSGKGSGGGGGGGGRGMRQAWKSEAEGSKEEVARERMDNIRVYSLIFLVKVRLMFRHANRIEYMHCFVEAGVGFVVSYPYCLFSSCLIASRSLPRACAWQRVYWYFSTRGILVGLFCRAWCRFTYRTRVHGSNATRRLVTPAVNLRRRTQTLRRCLLWWRREQSRRC